MATTTNDSESVTLPLEQPGALNAEELEFARKTLPESFNIYQAMLTGGSIIFGFIASILVALLTTPPPAQVKAWPVTILVAALLLVWIGINSLNLVALRVVRRFGIFHPKSWLLWLSTPCLAGGIAAVFVAVGLLLFDAGSWLWIPGSVMFLAAAFQLFAAYFGLMQIGKGPHRVDVDILPKKSTSLLSGTQGQ
jgi:hypothetical protein